MDPGIAGDAGIRGADILAPPVVVEFVDPVDEHEARFGEVVGGGHDDVPHAPGRHRLVDAAGDETFVFADVAVPRRPFAPDHLGRILQVDPVFLGLALSERERQRPGLVVLDGSHELVGYQQREIELPQPAVLALGANELHGVRMADIEGAHLRAAATARRRHREAHLVVDVHERQRTGGMRSGAGYVGAARPEGREFVADAAAGLERHAGFVDLLQNVVHGVPDRVGDGAVDRRGRGLVLSGAGVGDDAPRGDRAALQRPDESLVPIVPARSLFHVGQRPGDTLAGAMDVLVDGLAGAGLESVFCVPDVE